MLTTESDLKARCHALLVELNLIAAKTEIAIEALTGGVASDIALVSVDQRQWCVKFALPKLKVAADWFAPVERNAAEYACLTIGNYE